MSNRLAYKNGNRKKQFVLTFESFCLKPNRLLSCLQIPSFSDRKRFGGGALKNFHYDWAALALWKSEPAVAVVTAFLLLCQVINFSGSDKNISKCYLTLSWKIERKQRVEDPTWPLFCVAHLPVPVDILWKSLVQQIMSSDKGCTENWLLHEIRGLCRSAVFPHSLLKA